MHGDASQYCINPVVIEQHSSCMHGYLRFCALSAVKPYDHSTYHSFIAGGKDSDYVVTKQPKSIGFNRDVLLKSETAGKPSNIIDLDLGSVDRDCAAKESVNTNDLAGIHRVAIPKSRGRDLGI